MFQRKSSLPIHRVLNPVYWLQFSSVENLAGGHTLFEFRALLIHTSFINSGTYVLGIRALVLGLLQDDPELQRTWRLSARLLVILVAPLGSLYE